jgi:hypothetical protein
MGALALDAGAFEDIESDRRADIESVLVVLTVCAAAGMAAIGLGLAGPGGFIAGAIVMLGAWLVWVAIMVTLGTITLAEPQTHSDVHELLRVLGYAAAPGAFLALAVMRAAAPIVVVIVAVWMSAAAVLAVRQALDYRSTFRAIAVCGLAWLLSFGILWVVLLMASRTVR